MPEDRALVREVSTQDFIEYGFEAEFVGRLPVRVVCEHLEADDLFHILKDSEGSVIRQYERDFEAFGIQAHFEDCALHAIAEQAAREETGARGLLTVCERTLRDFKFELPGTSVEELKITGELVKAPREFLDRMLDGAGDIVDQKVVSEVAMFSRSFREKHGVDVAFENSAIQAIEELVRTENASALQICNRLFRDYQFGLKLIQKNNGQEQFVLPAEAISNPDRYLSDLVVKSYEDASSQSGVDDSGVSTEDSAG